MPKKKTAEPESPNDDILDLAWRLAPYIDFQGWELRGCPPRKQIVVMMQEAREFVNGLLALQPPTPVAGAGGREIVEAILQNADLLVAATMSRANGDVVQLLDPEKKPQTESEQQKPEVRNRYGIVESAKSEYLRTNFLSRLLVIRMLDLGLAVLERGICKPSSEINQLLKHARDRDRKFCRGVTCDLEGAPKSDRPEINPFAAAGSSDLEKWYALFCQPLLEMMLGGPNPLDVRGRGKKSSITMLVSSVFWQAPGWVRFLKLKKDEELELWRCEPEGTLTRFDDPVDAMPEWVTEENWKGCRNDAKALISSTGKLLEKAPAKNSLKWVGLPAEASLWLNDGEISSPSIDERDSLLEGRKLDASAVRLLSEWVSDFGFRYGWPVGIERCKALEHRANAANAGAVAIIAGDANLVASHREWVAACARVIGKAAASVKTDLCRASASFMGGGSRRADSGPMAVLARDSADTGRFESRLLTPEEVRAIRLGIHPENPAQSLRDRASSLLSRPEAGYRRLRATFEFEDQISNCFTRLQEKQASPKKQEKHLAKIRDDIEKLESTATEAGIDLGLGRWPTMKGAVGKRLNELRKAIPQYRTENLISLEDLDLVIAGADARLRVMESLLNLPPKKRKAMAP